MKKYFLLSSLIICLLFDIYYHSLHSPNPNFHIYLAFGQSNMQGAGKIEDQDLYCPERFKMMAAVDFPTLNRTKGNWYTATPPICREKEGLSPCDYFGREMVKKLPKNIIIGIINVSVFGISIDAYLEDLAPDYLKKEPECITSVCKYYDFNLFRTLINLAKKAKLKGVIKGILMHQGERNAGDKNWPKKIKTIYKRMLKELNLKAKNVPLLVGEVVNENMNGVYSFHNKLIDSLPEIIPNTYVIKSDSIEPMDDRIHFSSKGNRDFGKRYAEQMLKIMGY